MICFVETCHGTSLQSVACWTLDVCDTSLLFVFLVIVYPKTHVFLDGVGGVGGAGDGIHFSGGRLFHGHAVPLVEQAFLYSGEESRGFVVGQCFNLFDFVPFDVDIQRGGTVVTLYICAQFSGVHDVGAVLFSRRVWH